MALAQSVFDVGAGAAQIASGDIVGGISSMVSGISSIFAMGKKVKAKMPKCAKNWRPMKENHIWLNLRLMLCTGNAMNGQKRLVKVR